MHAPTLMSSRAYAYLLQYRPSTTRGEARNVAVALVAEDGGYAAVKHLPPSQLAERLRESGIVDSALVSLAQAVRGGGNAAGRLEAIRSRGAGSLLIGEPMPTDLGGEPDAVLAMIFRTLVARPSHRRTGRSKAEVLDRTVASLRHVGAQVRIGQYVNDFLLDAVIEPRDQPLVAVHAQSFDSDRKEWAPIEHEAGHFLYAVHRLRREAIFVVEPPSQSAPEAASTSYERISRWLVDAGVALATTPSLPTMASRYESRDQLPLFMST
jgi:hypothetical protein